jgi:hypothetical protein
LTNHLFMNEKNSAGYHMAGAAVRCVLPFHC